MKIAGFHVKTSEFQMKDHLQGMVTPMFISLLIKFNKIMQSTKDFENLILCQSQC